DGDVVDGPSGDAARDEALRAIGERRLHPVRCGEPLDLPEQLVRVPARPTVAVRRALSGRPVAPSLAGARFLEPGDRLVELVRALRAPGDVPEPGRRRLGQLQRVE